MLQDDLKNTEYVNSIINSDPSSMFWDRILGTLPKDVPMTNHKCQKHLQNALNIFGVKSMIIGHTPQFHSHGSGISWTCNNEEVIQYDDEYNIINRFDNAIKAAHELNIYELKKIIRDAEKLGYDKLTILKKLNEKISPGGLTIYDKNKQKIYLKLLEPHGLYRVDFGGSHAFHMFDKEFRDNIPNGTDISSDHVESEVMNLRKPQVLEIVYKNHNNLNDVPIVSILI